MKTLIFIIVITALFLLSMSCSKEEPVQTQTPEPTPLLGTNWKLQLVEFSYSDTLVDPSTNWKSNLIDSGMVTIFGNIILTLSDTTFNLSVELDPLYTPFFPGTLLGLCSGTLIINNNLLTFHSQSAIGIFVLGREDQEAYANYDIQGEKLSLSVIIPAYIKVSMPPGYVKVGEEYYNCTFEKQ